MICTFVCPVSLVGYQINYDSVSPYSVGDSINSYRTTLTVFCSLLMSGNQAVEGFPHIKF